MGPDPMLVELDQPLDQKTRPNQGPRRRYRQVRFRPPQGIEGMEPEFFEGSADYRGCHEGIGTEEQGDTGSPSSIMLARWKQRRAPEVTPTMPEAKVERDDEEQRNMDRQQAEYDMQQR